MKTRLFSTLLFGVFVTSGFASAHAGKWIIHEFGELRSYHGDWLNVCADMGRGDCRSVHYELKPGGDTFFGDSVVTVHRLDGGGYAVGIFARDLSAERLETLTIEIDGEPFHLPASARKAGTLRFDNVVDTVTVVDPDVASKLVQAMQAGNWMDVQFAPAANDGTARIRLRGITAALGAIEDLIEDRKN